MRIYIRVVHIYYALTVRPFHVRQVRIDGRTVVVIIFHVSADFAGFVHIEILHVPVSQIIALYGTETYDSPVSVHRYCRRGKIRHHFVELRGGIALYRYTVHRNDYVSGTQSRILSVFGYRAVRRTVKHDGMYLYAAYIRIFAVFIRNTEICSFVFGVHELVILIRIHNKGIRIESGRKTVVSILKEGIGIIVVKIINIHYLKDLVKQSQRKGYIPYARYRKNQRNHHYKHRSNYNHGFILLARNPAFFLSVGKLLPLCVFLRSGITLTYSGIVTAGFASL